MKCFWITRSSQWSSEKLYPKSNRKKLATNWRESLVQIFQATKSILMKWKMYCQRSNDKYSLFEKLTTKSNIIYFHIQISCIERELWIDGCSIWHSLNKTIKSIREILMKMEGSWGEEKERQNEYRMNGRELSIISGIFMLFLVVKNWSNFTRTQYLIGQICELVSIY